MMVRALRGCCFALLVVLPFIGFGCAKPTERLNAPPQGHSCYPNAMQDNYTPMADNAMLADMSMSDAHFVPHTSELSGTGVRRLDRYASLLKIYGGTLHYDGTGEEAMSKARIDRMTQFLVCAGVDPNKFSVEPGMAGGSGMRSDEALAARQWGDFDPGHNDQVRESWDKNRSR